MFRARQKIPFEGYIPCILPRVIAKENGSSALQYVDDSTIKLPDPSVTDLADMLAAGVNLEQVNTKLFTPESVVIHVDDDSNANQNVNRNSNQGE